MSPRLMASACAPLSFMIVNTILSRYGRPGRKNLSKRSRTRYSPGLYSTNLNGPEPTGELLRGWVRIGAVEKMCFGTIGVRCGDRDSSSEGTGRFVRMMAVYESGVSTPVTFAYIATPNGWLFLTMSIENATSAEVTGMPSWNTAFFTRWNVVLNPSFDTSQDSAR